MNFPKLFDVQKAYESAIDYNDNSRLVKKVLALITEVGEALNERPAIFKFWSKNPKGSSIKNAEHYAALYQKDVVLPEGDSFLGELSDIFHFVLSLGLELKIDPKSIQIRRFGTINETEIFLLFSQSVLNLYTLWTLRDINPHLGEEEWYEKQYEEVISRFLILVESVGYSQEEIEEAFYIKNEVNIQRQLQGY